MSARTDRACLLLQQSRFDLAAQELRLALADDPDDPFAHALLAQCLIGQKEFAAAAEEAERAIACGPDRPLGYYALALAHYHRNRYPEAEAAVAEAVRLDPGDPDFHALSAAVHAAREQWLATLTAAERGLEHDPTHGWCRNLRAMALLRLGRRGEAGAALDDALARDPDDAFTHANRGWVLLHEGDHKRARDHFREALRLDPQLEYARAGMAESLKAGNWLYRQLLGYFLWLSRLSPSARWGVVIGLLVLQRVVATTAEQNPGWRPVLEPLLIAYVAFVLTTWTAGPLSNLLLRLHPFGRHALSRAERRASNWVGGFVAVALVGVGWGLFAPSPYDWPGWLSALAFMVLLLPLSGVFACQPGWPRLVMVLVTAGMFVLAVTGSGLLALGFYMADRNPAEALDLVRTGAGLLRVNNWAALGSALLANLLMGVQPRS